MQFIFFFYCGQLGRENHRKTLKNKLQSRKVSTLELTDETSYLFFEEIKLVDAFLVGLLQGVVG